MSAKDKLKYALKSILAYLFYFCGVLHLYKFIHLRNKAIVLMYHRILSESDRKKSFSNDGIIVNNDTFKKHICFLKKTFNIISHDIIDERINNQVSFDNYSCLITFDDGWRDNYTEAYPILKKYNVPAVIFLPIGYIESNKIFWQEELAEKLYLYCRNPKLYKQELLEKYNIRDISELSDRDSRRYIKGLVNQLKQYPLRDIEDIISGISGSLKQHDDKDNKDLFMSWKQIKLMAMNGISFGSHGVSHKILTKISLEDASEEIESSKKIIEEQLGLDVVAFAYPNGNFDADIADKVKSHGYRLAFSTKRGYVTSAHNPYIINRINIHNDVTTNIPMFFTRILGIF